MSAAEARPIRQRDAMEGITRCFKIDSKSADFSLPGLANSPTETM
jgi:hypothetical protein